MTAMNKYTRVREMIRMKRDNTSNVIIIINVYYRF